MLALPTLFISISANADTPLNPAAVEKGKYFLVYHAYEKDVVGYYYKDHKNDDFYRIGCGDPEINENERKYAIYDSSVSRLSQNAAAQFSVQKDGLFSVIKNCIKILSPSEIAAKKAKSELKPKRSDSLRSTIGFLERSAETYRLRGMEDKASEADEQLAKVKERIKQYDDEDANQ